MKTVAFSCDYFCGRFGLLGGLGIEKAGAADGSHGGICAFFAPRSRPVWVR
jgi:hypothetical protein